LHVSPLRRWQFKFYISGVPSRGRGPLIKSTSIYDAFLIQFSWSEIRHGFGSVRSEEPC